MITKMKKIKKEDAVHKKYPIEIAVSNVFLCVVCIAGIFLTMFAWFQQYVRDEMTRMSYTQLSNTAQMLQSKLDSYQMQLQNLFQEPQIRAALYTDEKNLVQELGIYRYLNYSIVNDGIIDYAVIYKDNTIKQMIGPAYPWSEEQEKIVDYLNNSQNDREIYQYYDEKTKTGRTFLFRTEREVLGGPPDRGILFAINQKKLAKALFSEQDENHKQNVWVFDSAGNVLVKRLDSAENMTDEVWDRISGQADDSAVYEIEAEGENCYLVYVKSGDYNLNFVQMIDTGRLAGALRQMQYMALICVTAALVLCSAAAYALANYILYPLQKFLQMLTVSTAIAEKNEEGTLLTQITSERILSEISSMSRRLHTDKILGYLEDASQEDVPPKRLQLAENRESAVLVFIGSKIGRIQEDQWKVLRELLNQKPGAEIRAELYPEEGRSYCVLLMTEENELGSRILTDKHAVRERIQLLFQDIDMSEGGLYAFYSGELITAEQLQVEFRRLKQLSKYVLFGNFEMLNCSADYDGKTDEEIPKKLFTEILSAVKKGDDVKAKSLMPAQLELISHYEIKRIFHALSYLAAEIEQIYFQFSGHSRDYQEMYLEHYIKLTSLNNQKELYDYFSNIIEDACLEIRTSGERSLRTIMLDSIRYIEEHYTDSDLSVDQIAAVFHISNSYFSRMFNEICKFSFPEYVNELRLTHSARLLRNTDLSIREVAERSGFSSVSYFGSRFKKKYGVSPSAYRGK